MRLYLDDDCIARPLVQFLRKAGHDLCLPSDVGLAGADDAVHLRYAIREKRVLLSRNYAHFENLHHLILEAQGHHPGILVIRKDSNPKHNLKTAGVVQAIAKLLAAGVDPADDYVVLNHWR